MFHVEHSMNLSIVFIITTLLIFLGCKQPLPDPQQSDYIYQSIKQELAGVEAQLNQKRNQLNDFKSKLPETDIQSADIKMIRAKVDFATQEVRKLEQKLKYWKIKLLSREELVRTKYLAAFNKGEEWDNTLETENFKKSIQRLKQRLPASSTNVKSYTPENSEEHEQASEEE